MGAVAVKAVELTGKFACGGTAYVPSQLSVGGTIVPAEEQLRSDCNEAGKAGMNSAHFACTSKQRG